MKALRLTLLALCALVVLSGCKADPQVGSSGSNWLQCTTDADCVREGARSCDQEGFCLDAEGERVAAPRPTSGATDGGPSADLSGDAVEDSGEGAVDAPSCAWTTDALLAEVGVDPTSRLNCGRVGTDGAEAERESLWQCFQASMDAGEAVEASVNRCLDCVQETTYVATSSGDLYALERTVFGGVAVGEAATSTVRCEDVAWQDGDLACLQSEELESCTGDDGEDYAYPPASTPLVQPRTVLEVPTESASSTAVLHLFISHQTEAPSAAPIDVHINGVHVVTGDFKATDPASWRQFDIPLPLGETTLRAVSLGTDDDADFEDTFDFPEERWTVLDLLTGSQGQLTFEWNLHEAPPALGMSR